jgi:hypothetical protein
MMVEIQIAAALATRALLSAQGQGGTTRFGRHARNATVTV